MKHILVSRPSGQADALIEQLEQDGFRATHVPAMVIEADQPDDTTRNRLMNLDQYDVVFVASANAARQGLALLEDYWPQWPAGVHWIAVGEATARVLRDAGLDPEVPEEEASSEAVLALPTLADARGRSVLILRGRGGRELLAETLRERGARVDPVELYRRRCNPELAWPDEPVDAVLVTSVEGWHCLREQAPDEALGAALVIAGGERIATAVRDSGHERCETAASPRDPDMLACLREQFLNQEEKPMEAGPSAEPKATPGNNGGSPPSPPAPARKPAGGVALLLMIVLLAAGGWLAWFWIEETGEQRQALEERVAALEQAVQTQKQTREQALAERDRHLEALDGQLSENREALRALRETGRDDWALREAEALAGLARQRLAMTSDASAALRLLEAADRILARLADPELTPAREALAADMEALRRAEQVDRTGLALRLDALHERIPSVVQSGRPPAPSAHPPQQAEDAVAADSTWERILAQLPISIRRHDRPPMLPMDEQQNRQLQLLLTGLVQEASLALLLERPEGYREALTRARKLALEWLDETRSEVASFAGALDELRGREIERMVPEIGAGREAIRSLRRERDEQGAQQ